ncbi:MAG: NAD(P)/FAD-dependent oxidoreductase, partial [Ilumatobacter sp.]|nr:NAD(P)/FAD-dependent oxidoreductase [Ilumatobacter sp.]
SSTTIYGFVQGLPDDLFRNLLRPGEVVGVIPTNDGAANVWVTVGTDRFAHEARPDLAGFYDRILADVDEPLAEHVRSQLHGPLRSFPGLRGFLRQPFGPGWALVGDACYFKDPISAHGMTDALIGAELLARSVVDAVAGRDERAALAEYASQRAKLAEPMMPAVAHLASMTWSLDSARAAYRAASEAMRAEAEYLAALPAMPVLVAR